MLKTFNQAFQKNKACVLEEGPYVIALDHGKVTFVLKKAVPLNDLVYRSNEYTLDLFNVPQLAFKAKFSLDFYRSKLLKEKPAPPTKNVSIQRKSTFNTTSHPKDYGIWNPDGSLKKSKPAANVSIHYDIYTTSKEHKNCGKCRNLNTNNYCVVHRKTVSEDSLCKSFTGLRYIWVGGLILGEKMMSYH